MTFCKEMNTIRLTITGLFLLLASYKGHAEPQAATIKMQAESLDDFHEFIEGIMHLVASSPKSPIIINLAGANKLSFRSVKGFPGEPMMVHILQDGVAIGSGASRQSLTVDALKDTLELFAKAASSAGSEGSILLVSEEKVSGEFGLMILNTISEAGIPNIMLVTPELLEASRPRATKKPSAPSPNNKKQNKSEMATPKKPSD